MSQLTVTIERVTLTPPPRSQVIVSLSNGMVITTSPENVLTFQSAAALVRSIEAGSWGETLKLTAEQHLQRDDAAWRRHLAKWTHAPKHRRRPLYSRLRAWLGRMAKAVAGMSTGPSRGGRARSRNHGARGAHTPVFRGDE